MSEVKIEIEDDNMLFYVFVDWFHGTWPSSQASHLHVSYVGQMYLANLEVT